MRASELHRLARSLREIALIATGNIGEDSVNAGELAVLEDVARHPGTTMSGIVRRTGLAQSLVSRIVHAAADAGTVALGPVDGDRRKIRVELGPRTHAQIMQRAARGIAGALADATPTLSARERRELEQHLAAASGLLRAGALGEPDDLTSRSGRGAASPRGSRRATRR